MLARPFKTRNRCHTKISIASVQKQSVTTDVTGLYGVGSAHDPPDLTLNSLNLYFSQNWWYYSIADCRITYLSPGHKDANQGIFISPSSFH